nr:MAG TPA: tail assembly protein [Caudoviricetes sp.]
MLTKVILGGELAKVAGRKEWMLDCGSPSEAISLINANKPGVVNWMRQNLEKYKVYQVECEDEKGGKENLTNETYQLARKCKVIRFVPILTGAGGNNGILQAVVGVVMIVVGAVITGLSGGSGSPIGASLISAGVGMILGAICTMLMKPSGNDDDDGTSNYYFNGAVNTTEQGTPVPLVFGRCRVGSAVISSEITVTEA